MKRSNDVAQDLERLTVAECYAQQRLVAQQERLTRHFERARQRVSKKYGLPNDSQQRIINAALDLLDSQGLNDLSLRKLGGLLNIQAPALYWHFKNKGVLIDYMAEAILSSEFKELKPRSADIPWQDWLVNTCQRLRRAMLSHRDGGRIVAGAHVYPAVTLLRIFETIQESLISAGVDPKQADLLATTVIHLTFGRVIEEQSSPDPEELKAMDLTEMLSEFPRVTASIERTLKDNEHGYDEFEASLRLIVGYSAKV